MSVSGHWGWRWVQFRNQLWYTAHWSNDDFCFVLSTLHSPWDLCWSCFKGLNLLWEITLKRITCLLVASPSEINQNPIFCWSAIDCFNLWDVVDWLKSKKCILLLWFNNDKFWNTFHICLFMIQQNVNKHVKWLCFVELQKKLINIW